MIIHQKWAAVISATLLLLALGLFGRQALFVLGAEAAEGEVSHIEAHNGRCGSKHKYDCTEFTATIEFMANDFTHTTTTSAGSIRGHGASVQNATLHTGQPLPVLYSPSDPDHAYHNSVLDLWAAPIFAMIAQLMTMMVALARPSPRRRSSLIDG